MFFIGISYYYPQHVKAGAMTALQQYVTNAITLVLLNISPHRFFIMTSGEVTDRETIGRHLPD